MKVPRRIRNMLLDIAEIPHDNFGKTLRPDICVFAERKGEFLKEPFMMELSEEPGVDILRVLNDDELLAFIEKKGVDPFGTNKKATQKCG